MIADEMLTSLEILHLQKIIHLNFCPENIIQGIHSSTN